MPYRNYSSAERAKAHASSRALQDVCEVNGLSPASFVEAGAVGVTSLELFMGSALVDLSFARYFPNLVSLCVLKQLNLHAGCFDAGGLDEQGEGGFASCPRLEHLWVAECRLASTRGLAALAPHLRTLHLSSNCLPTLGRGLQRLAHLTTLWVCDNQLTDLRGVETLTQLRVLWVAGNHLDELWPWLAPLAHLAELNASANQIGSFKALKKLHNLPSLRTLLLHDPHFGSNPVCSLSNYGTFVAFQLPQVVWLDGGRVAAEAQALAAAVYAKKAMYYNMRTQSLKRDATVVAAKAEELLRHAAAPLLAELRALAWAAKDLEGGLAYLPRSSGEAEEEAAEEEKERARDAALTGEEDEASTDDDEDESTEGRDDGAQGSLPKAAVATAAAAKEEAAAVGPALACRGALVAVQKCAVRVEERLQAMRRAACDVRQRQLTAVRALGTRRVLLEFESGGNVRLDESTCTPSSPATGQAGGHVTMAAADPWCEACASLVASRFAAQPWPKACGISGVAATRTFRVHNRFLKARFEQLARDLGVDVGGDLSVACSSAQGPEPGSSVSPGSQASSSTSRSSTSRRSSTSTTTSNSSSSSSLSEHANATGHNTSTCSQAAATEASRDQTVVHLLYVDPGPQKGARWGALRVAEDGFPRPGAKVSAQDRPGGGQHGRRPSRSDAADDYAIDDNGAGDVEGNADAEEVYGAAELSVSLAAADAAQVASLASAKSTSTSRRSRGSRHRSGGGGGSRIYQRPRPGGQLLVVRALVAGAVRLPGPPGTHAGPSPRVPACGFWEAPDGRRWVFGDERRLLPEYLVCFEYDDAHDDGSDGTAAAEADAAAAADTPDAPAADVSADEAAATSAIEAPRDSWAATAVLGQAAAAAGWPASPLAGTAAPVGVCLQSFADDLGAAERSSLAPFLVPLVGLGRALATLALDHCHASRHGSSSKGSALGRRVAAARATLPPRPRLEADDDGGDSTSSSSPRSSSPSSSAASLPNSLGPSSAARAAAGVLSSSALRRFTGVGLSDLSRLVALSLHGCGLKSVAALSQCSSLQSLGLSGNRVRGLGPLCGLQHLVAVDVAFNRLTRCGATLATNGGPTGDDWPDDDSDGDDDDDGDVFGDGSYAMPRCRGTSGNALSSPPASPSPGSSSDGGAALFPALTSLDLAYNRLSGAGALAALAAAAPRLQILDTRGNFEGLLDSCDASQPVPGRSQVAGVPETPPPRAAFAPLPRHRAAVVRSLPSLVQLDKLAVSPEEHAAALAARRRGRALGVAHLGTLAACAACDPDQALLLTDDANLPQLVKLCDLSTAGPSGTGGGSSSEGGCSGMDGSSGSSGSGSRRSSTETDAAPSPEQRRARLADRAPASPPEIPFNSALAVLLTQVEDLHVGWAGLRSLPLLANLPGLRRASFAHNELVDTALGGLLARCPRLEELSLEGNHLATLDHLWTACTTHDRSGRSGLGSPKQSGRSLALRFDTTSGAALKKLDVSHNYIFDLAALAVPCLGGGISSSSSSSTATPGSPGGGNVEPAAAAAPAAVPGCRGAGLLRLCAESNRVARLGSLRGCFALQELYLAHNHISALGELDHLQLLPNLTIVDLVGNPLVACSGYRAYALFRLRRLQVLDGATVGAKEATCAIAQFEGVLTLGEVLAASVASQARRAETKRLQAEADDAAFAPFLKDAGRASKQLAEAQPHANACAQECEASAAAHEAAVAAAAALPLGASGPGGCGVGQRGARARSAVLSNDNSSRSSSSSSRSSSSSSSSGNAPKAVAAAATAVAAAVAAAAAGDQAAALGAVALVCGPCASLALSGLEFRNVEALGSAGLQHLRELDLGRNHLASFEGVVQHLPRLQVLRLNHNRVAGLRDHPPAKDDEAASILGVAGGGHILRRSNESSGSQSSSSSSGSSGNSSAAAAPWSHLHLKVLLLGFNKGVSVASLELHLFPKLRVLHLQSNGLVSTSGLGACTALRELSLSGNKLRDGLGAAEAHGWAGSLHALHLDDNGLRGVESLAGLTALTSLHLGGNRIASGTADLATELATLSRTLAWVSLHHNPCTRKPLYRATVVASLPACQTVDGVGVSWEERARAELLVGSASVPPAQLFLQPASPQRATVAILAAQSAARAASNSRHSSVTSSSVSGSRSYQRQRDLQQQHAWQQLELAQQQFQRALLAQTQQQQQQQQPYQPPYQPLQQLYRLQRPATAAPKASRGGAFARAHFSGQLGSPTFGPTFGAMLGGGPAQQQQQQQQQQAGGPTPQSAHLQRLQAYARARTGVGTNSQH